LPETLSAEAPHKDFLGQSERGLRHGTDRPDVAILGSDLHDRATGEALDLAYIIVIGGGEIHLEPTAKTVDLHLTLLFFLPTAMARRP
jgi:hypothetical protein